MALPLVAEPPIVRIVHAFNGSDGRQPSAEAPLVRGPLGTVFGVTMQGGARDEGALFFVDAFDRFHFVHSFSAGGRRGWMPNSVFFSESGQLYGTTAFGGTYDCGTAYRVNLFGKPTTVHDFDCVDGNQPSGRVVTQDGFFYGTTGVGGNPAAGTFYRMSTAGDVTVLREVPQNFSNEAGIYSGLSPGPGNEFYGYERGVFRGRFVWRRIQDRHGRQLLNPPHVRGRRGRVRGDVPLLRSSPQTEPCTERLPEVASMTSVRSHPITPQGDYSVVHAFDGEAATPYAGLVLGKNGNLYGTTVNGGLDGYGTVFELEPSGEFRVIYQFSGVNDFSYPQGGLVETAPGTFYGTTGAGGH